MRPARLYVAVVAARLYALKKATRMSGLFVELCVMRDYMR